MINKKHRSTYSFERFYKAIPSTSLLRLLHKFSINFEPYFITQITQSNGMILF